MQGKIFVVLLFMFCGTVKAQSSIPEKKNDGTHGYTRLVGKYDLGGRMIQFALYRNGLVLIVPGAPLQALENVGGNKFRSTVFKDLNILFVENGNVIEVQIKEKRGPSYGKKIDSSAKILSVEMDSLLMLSKSTEHFLFMYSLTDSKSVDSIAVDFEKNYKKILDDLKLKEMPRVTVRIYPGLESFHKGINFLGAPNNILATAFGKDDLRMVSPRNAGPEGWMLSRVAPHEFMHCVHLNIDYAPNNPTWLWEGLAQYEARWFFNPADLDFIRKKEFPSFTDLHSGLDYMLGYVIIEAIKDIWGFDTVVSLLKSRGDAELALNMDQKSFERKIYEHIYTKYVKKK